MYDDGSGALRTDLAGLENLRLEPWELKAARRTVAAGGDAPTERDQVLLRAVALRLKAEEEISALRSVAGACAVGGAAPLREGDPGPRAEPRREPLGGHRRGGGGQLFGGDPLLDPDPLPAPARHLGPLAHAGLAEDATAARAAARGPLAPRTAILRSESERARSRKTPVAGEATRRGASESDLLRNRRENLRRIEGLGLPSPPVRFPLTATVSEIVRQYGEKSARSSRPRPRR